MSEPKIVPPHEIEKMFARLGELKLDTSGIRRKFLNCPYGEDPKQSLDIYLPNEDEKSFPVVVFIHGGGWSGGSKSDNQLVAFIEGVRRGYAVVSMDHRLMPHVRYPDNLFDIKLALRWLAENAETYLLDVSRTALTGSSAGAHLAMMAAFTQGQAVFEGGQLTDTYKILAVVDQFGPSDFLKIQAHFDESGYPRASVDSPDEMNGHDMLLGAKLTKLSNMVRFMNPIDNVHPNIPPVLIQHGRYDPIIPYQQSFELYERIRDIAGADKAIFDLSEEFLHADPGYAGKESVDRIFGFIDSYLK